MSKVGEREGMKELICRLCHRTFQVPEDLGYDPSICERHNADGSLDEDYLKEIGEEL